MNTRIPDSPFKRYARFFLAVIASLLAGSLLSATAARASEQPKLVVQITVDALRGDLPSRFSNVPGRIAYNIEDARYHLLTAGADKKVGLANTLIVLSADHGQPEVPGHLHDLGIDKAHYFDTKALDKAPAIAALKKHSLIFGAEV